MIFIVISVNQKSSSIQSSNYNQNLGNEFDPDVLNVNTSEVAIENASPLKDFPLDLFTGMTFAIYGNVNSHLL